MATDFLSRMQAPAPVLANPSSALAPLCLKTAEPEGWFILPLEGVGNRALTYCNVGYT